MLKQCNAFLALIVLLACQVSEPTQPGQLALSSSIAAASDGDSDSDNGDKRVIGRVRGEGVANVGVPMDFIFNAKVRADGSAKGKGFHHAVVPTGVIEFRTRITCVSIDPVNNRAWIGGVITANNSTDPARMQPRNQVGRDIWWRVVDYSSRLPGVVDRTTFVGFAGDANIQTSEEYCAVRPWPGPGDNPPQPVDARTNPLISGDISVRAKRSKPND